MYRQVLIASKKIKDRHNPKPLIFSQNDLQAK